MKQLYNYNHLVRTFYRTKNKLQKLFATGKNIRKQDILKRRMQKLFAKISSFQFPVKKSIAACVFTASVFLLPHTAKAQIIFEQHPALNPFGLSPIPYSNVKPALADLDNDGDLDLMRGGSAFSYCQNFGTDAVPIFDTVVINPFSLIFSGSTVEPDFADLDADGDLDMLTGSAGSNFNYFENTGTASAPAFAPPVLNPFSLHDIGTFCKPSFADLDTDGDFDLLVARTTDLYYFENTGTSSEPEYAAPVTAPFGIVTEGLSFMTADVSDLDADGDPDLLVTGGSNYDGTCAYFFENTGSASAPAFAAPVKDPFELQGTKDFTFGDMDNDGDMDILSDPSWDIAYFENYGSSAEPDFNTATIANNIVDGDLALADMDADGDLDLLSSLEFGEFDYFKNEGTPEAPAFQFIPEDHPFYYLTWGIIDWNPAPAFTDLDDDGDIDLMAGDAYGDFMYFENIGTEEDAEYDEIGSNPFSLSEVAENCRPTFGDIDHDGDMDILAGNEDGEFGFFRNIGTAVAPLFDEIIWDPFSLDELDDSATPAFADLDNDGDLDMMSGDRYGDFYYYQNIGTMASPHFDAPQMNPMGLGDVGSYSTLAFGDLDNDGDVDMLGMGSSGLVIYYKNIPDISATFYIDGDGDGFGDPHLSARIMSGILPAGFTANNTDCDDNNALINSGAPEICNGLDDNCSGGIDDGLTFTDYYPDLDLDTYGDADALAVNACAPVADAVTNNTDCDDADDAVNPAAIEICNSIDDNCVGGIDDGLTFTNYYPDADIDTYGDADAVAMNACTPVAEAVTNNADCDDADAAVNPAATEVYNLIDDDCDGAIDEGTVSIQNINGAAENQFSIYPNPAHDQLTITCNYTNKSSSTITIKITDATGRTVLETTGEMRNGTIEKIIALSNEFESGVYYVAMQSAEYAQVLPLIVIK